MTISVIQRRVYLVLLALLLAGGAVSHVTAQGPPPVPAAMMAEAPADLLVQGAVDSELQPLLAALEGKREIQLAAWTFWRGRIGRLNVVVSRTDVGSINAVASTTLGIQAFRPKLVINQGTAGATVPHLKVFDIVVGEAAVDYGSFRSGHAELGAGIDMARWTPAVHRLRVGGKEVKEFKQFPGDTKAADAALSVPNPRGRVIKGVIGTAFEFNRELDRLVWINKTFGATTEDMESAFAAGAAQGLGVPFLAVRIISDNEFNAPEFQRIAGEYCAAFVVDVIRTKLDTLLLGAPETGGEAPPPGTLEYRAALKVSDRTARVDALKQIVRAYPKTSVAMMADAQILSELSRQAQDAVAALKAQAATMSAMEDDASIVGREGLNGRVASALSTAGLVLDAAESYARKALAALADRQAYVDARRVASRAEAEPNTPQFVSERAWQASFDSARQSALVTLGDILSKQGKADDAARTYEEAIALAPTGRAIANAAVWLADRARAAGRGAEVMQHLMTATLAGKVDAKVTEELRALYAASHGGSVAGLEETLDALYRTSNPPLLHVTPYSSTRPSGKTVLAEVFTGAGCPPCAGADLAIDGAMERYDDHELAVLMYHVHIPKPDPMANPSSLARTEYYGVKGVPTVTIDGKGKPGGGGPSMAPEIFETTLKPAIEGRLAQKPGARITLSGSRQGDIVSAKVSVKTPANPAAKYRVHIVLAENHLQYSGENGIRFHPMVVRAVAAAADKAQGFALVAGTGFSTSYRFDVSAIAAANKAHLDDFEVNNTRFGKFQFVTKKHDVVRETLSLVAFVQNDVTKEIVQSVIVRLR